MSRRFVILGNPENRRVTLFQEALARQQLPAAQVVSWLQFLTEGTLPFGSEPAFVRVDSFGENFAVQRLLLERGGVPEARSLEERHGELVEPAKAHEGFRAALRQLEVLFAKEPEWDVLNVPSEIDELFDKRRTSRRYRDAGIPVPEVMEDAPVDPSALLDACRRHGWDEAFVKLSCGSSASCLAHVELGKTGVLVRTSLEWDAPRWFNNLKVRHLRRATEIDRALGFILSQGAHVERGVPKARLGDAFFDLRVLCIAHEPRFIVVRQNVLPITNLHLGGFRGDLSVLKEKVSADAWEAAMETCRKVARLYRSLHVGIDLMFEPDLQAHRVLEANAFGDLLPNLTREGLDVWEWQIREALRHPPTGRWLHGAS